jgi:predicted O-linked N-acetylglucosamine transferase (SPINDLY family)
LANVLANQGDLAGARAGLKYAVAADPTDAAAHGALVFNTAYWPDGGLARIGALAEEWDRTHAARFKDVWPIHRRQTPGPRTIGFVSGDFRNHAVGFLVAPAVEALSRAGLQVICYANSTYSDVVTDRFRRAASAWREITDQTDEEVAAQIVADGVDILFDLSGHTAHNRLLVFARKPAPLQVAWVGCPTTTGMPAMDYLLADHGQVPPGAESYYAEKIIRLPDSYICFEPPDAAPVVGPLPMIAAGGVVTFGSFNVLRKIAPPVIDAWSQILHHVSGARLILKSPHLSCAATRARVGRMLVSNGIAADRVSLIGSTDAAGHMAAMAQADIALDSFPYTGGQTTLESLWTGLPVVTMAGETFAARHSFGYLSTIGLAETIAVDVEDYIRIAVGLAEDPVRLANLRETMRDRMLNSPLCDIDRYTRHLRAALQSIWQAWRDGAPPRHVTIENERQG